MTSYVLDASVAVKWYLAAQDEPLREQALLLADRYAGGFIRFVVPDLFFAEVGNIFWKAERNGRCTPKLAAWAVDEILELRLDAVPSTKLLRDAVSIASKYERSVYDSLYLALAVSANVKFLTADERLVNALRGEFPVTWLGAM